MLVLGNKATVGIGAIALISVQRPSAFNFYPSLLDNSKCIDAPPPVLAFTGNAVLGTNLMTAFYPRAGLPETSDETCLK